MIEDITCLPSPPSLLPSSGTITKLVRDFYLVPGAEWSLVREGQSVSVLGRLANGWYRCVALREAECQLEPIYAPSHSVISGLSELSADSGLPPSEGERKRTCLGTGGEGVPSIDRTFP